MPSEKKQHVFTSNDEKQAPTVAAKVNDGPSSYKVSDAVLKVNANELSENFMHLDLTHVVSGLHVTDAGRIAHLKLLNVFFRLKEDIGYNDGLFDLWDSRVSSVTGGTHSALHEAQEEALSKVREKRWALYVARAVDRFEAWFTSVLPQLESTPPKPLRQVDYLTPYPTKFVGSGKPQVWSIDTLPPIDVLLVWHSFMLNPRNYLEDCLRHGFKDLYATGLPWQTIDLCIDAEFNYNVPVEARDFWTSITSESWHISECSDFKGLRCPSCKAMCNIPWSTSGRPETASTTNALKLVGHGYGEKDFYYFCRNCNAKIDHNVLRVVKFKNDVRDSLLHNSPMPGAILFGTQGVPTGTFANRAVKVLGTSLLELSSRDGKSTLPLMEDVRDFIEKSMRTSSIIKDINNTRAHRAFLHRDERLSIRTMMSRYWNTHQLFSMDLAGAVIRQGSFTEKMRGIDWLHSPKLHDTMARSLLKYQRFMQIIASNPKNTAVPTLDVDLAWHTHQLSPASYYTYTTSKTNGIFIDHDDKIDENKLTDAFEWTSKTYETLYGEVYSECVCWYCETIRSRHTSTVARLVNIDRHERIADAFHNNAARTCDIDKSVHISSHNAVPVEELNLYTHNRLKRVKEMQLDEAYLRACRRATKKGRKPPDRSQHKENHFGYGYYGMYPYTGPYVYMTPSLYCYPMPIPTGPGVYGACAVGTCGGTVAAGACAPTGGCVGGAGSSGCGGGGGGGGCGGGGGGGGGGGCGGGGGGGGGGC